jgi:leader peptidase (prepilin peptidase) / N-methyltransferase
MSIAEEPLAVSYRVPAPIVVATLALAAGVALVQGPAATAVLRGVLVLVLVPCAVIDLRRRIIPNRITGPAAIAALVLGLALDAGHEPQRLLWAGAAGGFLLLAALANPAGMGMGDVKLVAVMGLFLGPPVVVALLLALLASAAVGVGIAVRRGIKTARTTGLPFGPYLAAGGVIAAVVGGPLVHAYLSAH